MNTGELFEVKGVMSGATPVKAPAQASKNVDALKVASVTVPLDPEMTYVTVAFDSTVQLEAKGEHHMMTFRPEGQGGGTAIFGLFSDRTGPVKLKKVIQNMAKCSNIAYPDLIAALAIDAGIMTPAQVAARSVDVKGITPADVVGDIGHTTPAGTTGNMATPAETNVADTPSEVRNMAALDQVRELAARIRGLEGVADVVMLHTQTSWGEPPEQFEIVVMTKPDDFEARDRALDAWGEFIDTEGNPYVRVELRTHTPDMVESFIREGYAKA